MTKINTSKENIKKDNNKGIYKFLFQIDPNHESKYFLLSVFIVAIYGALLYLNTLNVPFYFDDYNSIIDNPVVKNISNYNSLPNLFNFNDRFLAYLSFAINYHFSGLNPTSYHVVNILIHIINSVLVIIFFRTLTLTPVMYGKLNVKDRLIIGLLIGLIFATHPIQTQAVTYIVQRMTSLATVFYLIASIFYLKARLLLNRQDYSKIKRYLFILTFLSLCLVSFFLGIWSKQTVASLPLAFLLFEFLFIRDNNRNINWKIIATISLFFLTALTLFIFHFGLPAETYEISRSNYLLTQAKVLLYYIKLFFLPTNLNIDYEFPLSNSLFEPTTLISFLILSLLIIVGFISYKKYPIISFSIFWFFITLSVESSIIPIGDVIVEHRLYLPMIGFSTCSVYVIYRLLRKVSFKLIFFLALVCFYSFTTYTRNDFWKDPAQMWSDVISKSPHKDRPYLARGTFYLRHNKIESAIPDFKKAILLNKNNFKAYENLGYVYQVKNEYDISIEYCNMAIKIYPTSYIAYNNRGVNYIYKKDWKNALKDFKKAVALYNEYSDAYYNLGYVFFVTKEYKLSIDNFNVALRLNPGYHEIYQFLVLSHLYLDEKDKAREIISTMRTLNIQFPQKFKEVMEENGIM